MADNHPLPTPPLMGVPATAMGVAGTRNFRGDPVVMLELSNAVVHANFPMDLAQARQHVGDVQKAILEAEGLEVPKQGLIRG